MQQQRQSVMAPQQRECCSSDGSSAWVQNVHQQLQIVSSKCAWYTADRCNCIASHQASPWRAMQLPFCRPTLPCVHFTSCMQHHYHTHHAKITLV
jgi:hypothetical protein